MSSTDVYAELLLSLGEHRPISTTNGEALCVCEPRVWRTHQEHREHVADALLPVVREIAAEELEWAGEEVRTNHGTASRSAKRIYARADALTKPPDGPVR